MNATSNSFAQLAAINVNEHVEKKNGLSYLSWAWAVDTLLRADPSATWSYRDFNGAPYLTLPDGTAMVFCTVTAFGHARSMQLPVMDHRNRAIANPDAFQLNTAMQRALTKAIACHGAGLYLYAGDGLPEGEEQANPQPPVTATQTERVITPAQLRYLKRLIEAAKSSEEHIRDYFSLERLDDLPMKEFDRALQALRRSA